MEYTKKPRFDISVSDTAADRRRRFPSVGLSGR